MPKRESASPPRRPAPQVRQTEPPPTVSARWLFTALAITLIGAAFCGYCALALLFYQGQWQMLFHPSRAITTTPAFAGLLFEEIHFDVTDAGNPRLDGWWIPASPGVSGGNGTILYLHGAGGDLSDCVPDLAALHQLGVNVFAFDYQGFGRSVGRHPTERLTTVDSVAAWTYLTDTRHIPAKNVVVLGDGVGSVFAAQLAARFAPAGAILEDPAPTARQIFLSDARAQMLPLWLLQKEILDPAPAIARTHVPLLFLDRADDSSRAHELFAAAPYPKQYFDLRSAPAPVVTAAVRRFLDEVLH